MSGGIRPGNQSLSIETLEIGGGPGSGPGTNRGRWRSWRRSAVVSPSEAIGIDAGNSRLFGVSSVVSSAAASRQQVPSVRLQHCRFSGVSLEAAACGADPWHGMAAATSGVSEIAMDAQASSGVNGPSTQTAARAGARIRILLLLRCRDRIAPAAQVLIASRIKRKGEPARRLVGRYTDRVRVCRAAKIPVNT
jgi:hypothetical protein